MGTARIEWIGRCDERDPFTIRAVGELSAALTATGADATGYSVRTLMAGEVAGATVTGPGGAGVIRAVDWQGGQIELAFVGTLMTSGRSDNRRTLEDETNTGDFSADVTLSGANAPRGRVASNVTIKGDLTSELNFTGDVVKVFVVGTADGARVQATGSIGSLLLGASTGSDFLAGVAAGFAGRFATDAADLIDGAASTARINSLQIRGLPVAKGTPAPRFLEDSNFTAGALGTVVLKNAVDQQTYGLHTLAVRMVKHTDTEDAAETFTWLPGRAEPDSWLLGSPIDLLA